MSPIRVWNSPKSGKFLKNYPCGRGPTVLFPLTKSHGQPPIPRFFPLRGCERARLPRARGPKRPRSRREKKEAREEDRKKMRKSQMIYARIGLFFHRYRFFFWFPFKPWRELYLKNKKVIFFIRRCHLKNGIFWQVLSYLVPNSHRKIKIFDHKYPD